MVGSIDGRSTRNGLGLRLFPSELILPVQRPTGYPRPRRRHAGHRRANLPLFPGMFPDYSAPIARNAPDGVRELSTARWGMPSPVFALKAATPTRALRTSATSARRIGGDGSASKADALFRLRRFPRTRSCRTAAPARLVRIRRKPAACVLRRHLDALEIRSEGQRGRDGVCGHISKIAIGSSAN